MTLDELIMVLAYNEESIRFYNDVIASNHVVKGKSLDSTKDYLIDKLSDAVETGKQLNRIKSLMETGLTHGEACIALGIEAGGSK